MSFESLGLRAELLRALSKQGYTEPTPIQAQCIPPVLAGRDVLAGAQTGTGKTAGFALPLLQLLSASAPEAGEGTPYAGENKGRNRRRGGRGPRPERGPHPSRPVRVLVLTPTRELASQVEESMRTYGQFLPHRSMAIFGGVNIGPQIQRLRAGVDIVVATPGRLLDHLGQRTIDLSQVQFLVLDEADRMLDMGFIRDIRRILGALPPRRQTLFFSATFTKEIRTLAADFLHDPESVQACAPNAAAELVSQEVHPVDKSRKRALLSHLIDEGSWNQVLVFTRTKHGANRLSTQLATDGITSTAIHGNKSQGHRTRALRDFKRGAVRVLVATDIAARGLDIDQLPYVVNFDLSHVPEDYVHRIGRTGRAGREGRAISLVSADEQPLLTGIERLLKRDLPSRVIAGFEPRVKSAAAALATSRKAKPRPGAPAKARAKTARTTSRRSKTARVTSTRSKTPRTSEPRRQASPETPAYGRGGRSGESPSRRRRAGGRPPRPSRARAGM